MTNQRLLLQRGIRPTKARLDLIELLAKAKIPQTTREILNQFPYPVHKVTIYRDLGLLVEAGLAEGRRFKEGATRYRLSSARHTHDLVCENCGLIDEVELPHDLDQQEDQIAREKKFAVSTHALAFYGLCASCQR